MVTIRRGESPIVNVSVSKSPHVVLDRRLSLPPAGHAFEIEGDPLKWLQENCVLVTKAVWEGKPIADLKPVADLNEPLKDDPLERFAAAALTGLLATPETTDWDQEKLAEWSWELAERMLEMRP